MMPSRKLSHSSKDSNTGMTGSPERRPCLTALCRTALRPPSLVGPRLPTAKRLGRWRGKRQALSVTIEKLFGSFGFWDYVVILELRYLAEGPAPPVSRD